MVSDRRPSHHLTTVVLALAPAPPTPPSPARAVGTRGRRPRLEGT